MVLAPVEHTAKALNLPGRERNAAGVFKGNAFGGVKPSIISLRIRCDDEFEAKQKLTRDMTLTLFLEKLKLSVLGIPAQSFFLLPRSIVPGYSGYSQRWRVTPPHCSKSHPPQPLCRRLGPRTRWPRSRASRPCQRMQRIQRFGGAPQKG